MFTSVRHHPIPAKLDPDERAVTAEVDHRRPSQLRRAADGDGTTVTLHESANTPARPCVRLENGQAVDVSKAVVLAGYDTLIKTNRTPKDF